MIDLDDLMSRLEEVNAKDATGLTKADIDVVIAYHRHQRERRASGEKPSKPKIDIGNIVSAMTAKVVMKKAFEGKDKPASGIKRRI